MPWLVKSLRRFSVRNRINHVTPHIVSQGERISDPRKFFTHPQKEFCNTIGGISDIGRSARNDANGP